MTKGRARTRIPLAAPLCLLLAVSGGCGEEQVVDPAPDPDEGEAPEPLTAEDLDEAIEGLEGMRAVDGDPDHWLVRTAARAQLRDDLGVVYEPLTKTVDLPEECVELRSYAVVNRAGSILTSNWNLDYWGPGDQWSETRTMPPDDIDVELEFELDEDADGNPQLRFTSPFNNRFLFRLDCVDEDGESLDEEVRLECSEVFDEDGEVVPEGDTGRPSAGSMRLMVCGVPVEDRDAQRRLVDALREAIRGMGAIENSFSNGSVEGEDGNTYRYHDWRIHDANLSPAVLEERLEVIADAIGGEVVRDGTNIMLVGPGPCLMN